ncbi:MAG: rod shape-determining protein MreD [Sedimentisphaerales bacterium]|nr:rod shape-determining protein MreD [Sedimentisphaerales bacterium]
MRWLRFAVLILVATILQTGFRDVAWLGNPEIRPDLLLILLVFFATHADSRDAVITSFTIGFAADLASPAMGLMGPRIISFGLFGTLLSNLHNTISLKRLPFQAAAIFVMGIVTAALTHLLVRLRAEPVVIHWAQEFFWQPLLSAVIGPFLCLPVGWWMLINGSRRVRRRRRWPFR